MVIAGDVLIRIGVLLLLAPVALLHAWKLAPGLPPVSRRLAGIMLAAVALLILAALANPESSSFTRWLWHFHEEWNAPAMFASLQLAFVGYVSLLIAFGVRSQPGWQRIHWSGTGLAFLFMGLDEYLAIHEAIQDWEVGYVALGAAIVLSTLYTALRAPVRERLWHVVFLAGLAISVVGAMLLNRAPLTCERLAFLRLDGCLRFYLWEESFELVGIWLVLVAALGALAGKDVEARRGGGTRLYVFPAIWLLLLLLNSLAPRLEAGALARPAAVDYESGISLTGYHIDDAGKRAADSLSVRLYAGARQEDYLGVGFSIHLVDQVSGEPVAWKNDWAGLEHGFWPFGPDYVPLYRQTLEVHLPPDAPANRALWVVAGTWRKQGSEFVELRVSDSDLRLLNERQVILGEIALEAAAPARAGAVLARFDAGLALVGLDLPEGARLGETLALPVVWSAAADGHADYTQFLHFVHEESGAWWNHDQQPLGARLPTRLWYSGLADSEIWRVAVPGDALPGRYAVYTGLYRNDDLERVPARDVDGRPYGDHRVPLGTITIRR